MTPEAEALIARLEGLQRRASGNGRWKGLCSMVGDAIIRTESGTLIAPGLNREDAKSTVALHNAAPQLFATIREQAAEIERLRARVAAKTSTAKFKALLKAAEPSQ